MHIHIKTIAEGGEGPPGGSVVGNPPAQQETGSGPGPRRAHSDGAAEPVCPGVRALQGDAQLCGSRGAPLTVTGAQPTQQQGPGTATHSLQRRWEAPVCSPHLVTLPLSSQVLFDDLGQSLIRLSSPDLQFQLIAAFLQFLGVPSSFSPPTSCLYLAMDENSIFDNELYDEKPLTFLDLSCSGVGCVGRMDPLGGRRWPRGPSREGEEFIRNVFHLALPLFAGRERSQLCVFWLRYEITKVTLGPPPWVGTSAPVALSAGWRALGVLQGAGPQHLLLQGPKGTACGAAPSRGCREEGD